MAEGKVNVEGLTCCSQNSEGGDTFNHCPVAAKLLQQVTELMRKKRLQSVLVFTHINNNQQEHRYD